MASPYPIVIEIDGRKHKGQWTLRQGGVLKVSCPLVGTVLVEIGCAEPVAAAQEALRGLVAAHQAKRLAWEQRCAEEMAALHRKNVRARRKRSDMPGSPPA